MRLLIWAAAIGGLFLGVVNLLAEASDGFTVPGWVIAAAVVCLGGFAVLLLVERGA